MFSRTRYLVIVFQAMLLPTLFFCLSNYSKASDLKFLDVEDLTQISTHVFRGLVLSSEPRWTEDHQRIYTSTKILVNESFKGPLSKGQIVTVNQLGGEIDGMRLDYEARPMFTVGEQVVLFTTEPKPGSLVVMALKQGKMQVE